MEIGTKSVCFDLDGTLYDFQNGFFNAVFAIALVLIFGYAFTYGGLPGSYAFTATVLQMDPIPIRTEFNPRDVAQAHDRAVRGVMAIEADLRGSSGARCARRRYAGRPAHLRHGRRQDPRAPGRHDQRRGPDPAHAATLPLSSSSRAQASV